MENTYKIWHAGDNNILIDFGLEKNIILNIKAALVKELLIKSETKGIAEMIPSNSSLAIKFDPTQITPDELSKVLNGFIYDVEHQADIEVESRVVELPVLFDDPWTKASVEEYCEKIKPIENNIQKIITENKLKDLDELIYYYTYPQFWVTYVGFTPGLASMLCLDPRFSLNVPKYNPPRTSTPKGAIGIGGSNTSIYPCVSPGGFQLFGITPTPIFDEKQRLDAFKDSMVLLKVTDRIKFRPVNMDEYNRLVNEVEAGTYQYSITNYDKFSVRMYKDFIAEVSN